MIAQNGILELSAANLRRNVQAFKNRLAGHVTLGATVKANAYGHGLEQIVPILPDIGISWLCVYSLDEAVAVAALESTLPILVLAPIVLTDESSDIPPRIEKLLAARRVRLTLTDIQSACYLSAHMLAMGSTAPQPVHIQVDTGLTRQGVAMQELPALIEQVHALSAIRLEGLFMHFSHADQPEHNANRLQFSEFVRAAANAKKRHPQLILHAHNSGGAWHDGFNALNMVRLGIAMYGLQPSLAAPIAAITPVARVVAPITAIHDCPVGAGVGYGHTFVTTRNSRLGIVPVGYADGYPRELSNRCFVLHGEMMLPVVGRVSMDQTVVDLTDTDARVGDCVTLISDDPQSPISMDHLAEKCNTIGYELATRLGNRLHRRLTDESSVLP
jgi:alanine racemase